MSFPLPSVTIPYPPPNPDVGGGEVVDQNKKDNLDGLNRRHP